MSSEEGQIALCYALEKKVRVEAQSKSIYDPELKALRLELRNVCEKAILSEVLAGQDTSKLEAVLWRVVFYKVIEEHRRKLSSAQGGGAREKTRNAFLLFLTEAEEFYSHLASSIFKGCNEPVASIARCLVFMGDLRRYSIKADAKASPLDWEPARIRYSQASFLDPNSGNAYNQLAVLASYTGQEELVSSYYYIRALAVKEPFPAAHGNLMNIFDSTRKQETADGRTQKKRSSGSVGKHRGSRPTSDVLRELQIQATCMLSILYTQVDLDACSTYLETVLSIVDDVLVRMKQHALGGGGGGDRRRRDTIHNYWGAKPGQPDVLFCLSVSALYCVDKLYSSSEVDRKLSPAALRVARKHGASLILSLTSRLAAVACQLKLSSSPRARHSPFLLSLSVLLQWLATSAPTTILITKRESEDVTAQRIVFWKRLTQLHGTLSTHFVEGADAVGNGEPALKEEYALKEDYLLSGFGGVQQLTTPSQIPLEPEILNVDSTTIPSAPHRTHPEEDDDVYRVQVRMQKNLSVVQSIARAAALEGLEPGLVMAIEAFRYKEDMIDEEVVYQPDSVATQETEKDRDEEALHETAAAVVAGLFGDDGGRGHSTVFGVPSAANNVQQQPALGLRSLLGQNWGVGTLHGNTIW